MNELLRVARALGDPNRVRAFLALEKRELCACQLIELLGLAPSTVSKHMAVLKHAGLVDSRKSGRWVHYRCTGKRAVPAVREAIAWAHRSLRHDPQITRDRRRLVAILLRTPAEACDTDRSPVTRRSAVAAARR
ncbi:MAG: metalloregulator ArsR/SmtB family transcription factor [Candidatus Eisenbacteria bacterium]|nr:metalloregulator ArsR/SmtB family transcription factor [Candidatus Eisenbacteria bacterium]